MALRELAAAYGVQRSYIDAFGRRRRARVEALVATLSALGADLDGPDDAPAALVARNAASWAETCDPVVTAWGGRGGELLLRLPAASAEGSAELEIAVEDGETLSFRVPLGEASVEAHGEVGGRAHVRLRIGLPLLPLGYHEVRLRAGRREGRALVLSAPRRAAPSPERTWGVFAPLYALSERRTWGTGDLSTLRSLLSWTGSLGGGVVATLPLLAAFLDEPFEPSPYAPVSRRFWNELYVDATAVPELAASEPARDLIRSRAFRAELRHLRGGETVDHRGVMAVKRRVLELLAAAAETMPARAAALERFAAATPELDAYARFRATVERRRTGWSAWPAGERDGRLRNSRDDLDAVRYHRYVQWVAEEQLGTAVAEGRRAGAGLLLDLPLGVHRHGFDVWRERDSFAVGCRAGAPPDEVFPGGQDWGFPPLHPERSRRWSHRVTIESVRHLARHAAVIRVDHVMGLHRLYWIPPGFDKADGVYVRYPADELSAILAMESLRSGAAIVGEDLGTVPPVVRPAMARRGFHRAYVVQFQVHPDRRRALGPVPAASLASVNTHDTPTFASFWTASDVDLLEDLGVLDRRAAAAERRARLALHDPLMRFLESRGWLASREREDPSAVLRGCLRFLATSPAAIVVATLEDLWLEPRPQNVPGTHLEHPNWRRRAAIGLDELRTTEAFEATLREIDRLRRGA